METYENHYKDILGERDLILCINIDWNNKVQNWKISPWGSDGDGLQAPCLGVISYLGLSH